MEEKHIVIPAEDMEIIDASAYKTELTQYFENIPEVAQPLLKEAKVIFSKIEKKLYTAPAFINAVKAAVREIAGDINANLKLSH